MEAINHCFLSYNDLKAFLESKNLLQNVLIPVDGEIIEFS